MSIGDFDYIKFAKDLAGQVPVLLPADLENESEQYIKDTLYAFTIMAGQALCNEDTIEIEIEEAQIICQLIAEWTFHKGVDLAHSEIPQEFWDSILQKIAFTVFEVAKQGIERKIQTNRLIEVVERHVNKVWQRCVNDLLENSIITDEVAKTSRQLSNIDVYSTKNNDNVEFLEKIYKSNSANKKITIIGKIKQKIRDINTKILQAKEDLTKRYEKNHTAFWIAAITSFIVYFAYQNYKTNIYTVLNEHGSFMNIIFLIGIVIVAVFGAYKLNQKSLHKELNKLQDIKHGIEELSNADNMYNRLGVETIMIEVGSGLLSISDTNQEGTLLPKIVALRQELTDELGYIVPNVRIIDNAKLEQNEYTISIRDNVVSSGFVYPDRYMVSSDEWDKYEDNIPETAIIGVNPIYQTQAYWIEKNDINSKVQTLTSEEVVIKQLKETLIKNVENILTISNVQKLISYVDQKEVKLYEDIKGNGISEYDLQKIFANLIKEKVSIKDIVFIFEKLADISRYSKNTNILTEQLRGFLNRQICLKNVGDDKVLYTLNLSQEIEKKLSENVSNTEQGVQFNLNPTETEELVRLIKMDLMYVQTTFNINPVILCSSSIRLPLYQLLERYIPMITVLAYEEVISGVAVESLHVIGEDVK